MVKSSKLLLSPNGNRCVALFEVLGIHVTKKDKVPILRNLLLSVETGLYITVFSVAVWKQNPGWSKVEHLGGCGHRPEEKCQWLGLEW